MTEVFLKIPEVAAKLRRHPRTVRRWVRSGKLNATRLPGRGSAGCEYLIAEKDLQLFLERHARVS